MLPGGPGNDNDPKLPSKEYNALEAMVDDLTECMENLTKLHDFSVFYCTSPDLARDVAALRPKMPWCFIH